jgi:hypothetical protein
MNNSIKRAQSQARLSFAERENFRPKVRQYKKLMMTLALLLTAVTGAWATDGVIMKELTVPSEWNNDSNTPLTVGEMTGFKDFSSLTDDEAKALLNSVPTGKVFIIYGAGASSNSFKLVQYDGTTTAVGELALSHSDILGFKDNSWRMWIGKIGSTSYDDDPYYDLETKKFAHAIVNALDKVEEFIAKVEEEPENYVQFYKNL